MNDDDFDALGYLQAVYRGHIVAESQRMRAAIAALPLESPKLAVVASGDRFFAGMMKEVARRLGRRAVIDAQPNFQKVEVVKEEH